MNIRDNVDAVMTDVVEVRERTTILSDWVDVVTVIYLCTARLSKGREGGWNQLCNGVGSAGKT